MYKSKYLKYKNKYLNLKNQIGGTSNKFNIKILRNLNEASEIIINGLKTNCQESTKEIKDERYTCRPNRTNCIQRREIKEKYPRELIQTKNLKVFDCTLKKQEIKTYDESYNFEYQYIVIGGGPVGLMTALYLLHKIEIEKSSDKVITS